MTQEPTAPEPDLPDSASEQPKAHAPAAVHTLRQAMRRARVDDAERTGIVADLRATSLARLEMLQEALRPLIAQIPADADVFDVGLMPGASPRLFVDMIGFVEMARDGRVYRFLQDTRYGRIRLAESGSIDTMVDAVTEYVARRLLERDKALVSDTTGPMDDVPAAPSPRRAPPRERRPEPAATARRTGVGNWIGIAFAFIIDLLGSITFFTILATIAWLIWTRLHAAS